MVTARASSFTDRRMSGLPMHAKYKYFRTIWEQTFDNSPTDPISSSLNWWSSRHGVATWYNCWVVLFASSQYRYTHFFAWPFISKDHEEMFAPIFLNKVAFLEFLQRFWIQTYFCNCPQYLCLSDILAEYNPNNHGQGMMLARPNRLLSWTLSTLARCFVSSQPVLYRPHIQTRIAPSSLLTNKHFQFGTFSQPCSKRTFSNSSHNCPATRWPYRFRSRGTTGSSILDHDWGHLCFGGRIQISGHSDFGICSNVGASSILTSV